MGTGKHNKLLIRLCRRLMGMLSHTELILDISTLLYSFYVFGDRYNLERLM